jgi:hypothetical protein
LNVSQGFLRNPRTKDFVASSAAALVSDVAYRSDTPNRQQTSFAKSRKSRKALKLWRKFRHAPVIT